MSLPASVGLILPTDVTPVGCMQRIRRTTASRGGPAVRGLPVMCSRSPSSRTAPGHLRLRLPVRRR